MKSCQKRGSDEEYVFNGGTYHPMSKLEDSQQSENAKKAIAAGVNSAINQILANGPSEVLIRKIQNDLELIFREYSVTPADAIEGLTQYYRLLYKDLCENRGFKVKEITTGGNGKTQRLNDFPDEVFLNIQPKLEKHLMQCVGQANTSAASHRNDEITQSMHEFEEWAKSIPLGGSKEKSVRAEARAIRSCLKGTAEWQKRFFVIHLTDFAAGANHLFALANADVLAGKWKWSVYTCECKLHETLNGKIYFNRGNWAEQKGLIQVSENDYFENNPIPGTNGCNCYYVYMHHLRDMPKTALTQAGIKLLDESARYIETLLETKKEQPRKSSEPSGPWWKSLFRLGK